MEPGCRLIALLLLTEVALRAPLALREASWTQILPLLPMHIVVCALMVVPFVLLSRSALFVQEDISCLELLVLFVLLLVLIVV